MARPRQVVFEKGRRIEHGDAFFGEFVGDRAKERLGVAFLYAGEDHEHSQVRPQIEKVSWRNLAHHHRFGHSLAFEKLDHLAELGDAEPLGGVGLLGEFGSRLAMKGSDGEFHAGRVVPGGGDESFRINSAACDDSDNAG